MNLERGDTEQERQLALQVAMWKERAEKLEGKCAEPTSENHELKSQLFRIRYDNITYDPAQVQYVSGLSPGNWSRHWTFLKPSSKNILSEKASITRGCD